MIYIPWILLYIMAICLIPTMADKVVETFMKD